MWSNWWEKKNEDDTERLLQFHSAFDDMQPWQKEYAIADTFNKGVVFVPDSSSCVCKLFRVQHDDEDPTHEPAQRDVNK